MVKRMLIMLALAGGSFAGIWGYKTYPNSSGGLAVGAGIPTQTVSAITAQYQQISVPLKTVGNIQATRGVEISSQVAGTVAAIHFDSDAEVRKGELLVELTAAEDISKLKALEATADLSKLTHERALLQLSFQAVSQHVVDIARETWKRDQALVEQQRALLELKQIRAPFAGGLGIRRVNIGQYLEPGTPIATLQELDAVYLDFYLPQQAIGEVHSGHAVVARVDAYPNRVFQGTISAIDRSVNPESRNLHVRATLKNSDHALLPGMFAVVEITAQSQQQRIAVPQTAINYHSYGNTVFLIESQPDAARGATLVAREVAVTTGDAGGDQIVVLDGIREGQTVVTVGQSKLANGTPVLIDNSIAPSADPHPAPIDN